MCVTVVAMMAVLSSTGCATSQAKTRAPRRNTPTGRATTGEASYYAARFDGRPTAKGERFDNAKLTAAHRTLPFGTKLRVTNLSNGRSVVVRVNDRGPFARGRIIDLSQAAARKLDMIRAGVARVRVEPAGSTSSRAVTRVD